MKKALYIIIALFFATVLMSSSEAIKLIKYFGQDSAFVVVENQHDQVRIGIDEEQNLCFQDSANGCVTLSNLSGGANSNPPAVSFYGFASTSDNTFYSDGYIELFWDAAATDDLEITILTNPASEKVHVLLSDLASGALNAFDLNTASGQTVIDSSIGQDDRINISVFAPSDSNYPGYRISLVKTNSTSYTGAPVMVLVEKWTGTN